MNVNTSTDHKSNSWGWVGAVSVIAVGLIFLLRTTFGLPLQNWWAALILLPAIMFFARAWQAYQGEGELTSSAITWLVTGLLITYTAFVFLLNLSFSTMWPFSVLIIGGGMLLHYFARK
ncbi:MAG: hypothetical protein AAF629_14575 [Chloroflexota bacterium]